MLVLEANKKGGLVRAARRVVDRRGQGMGVGRWTDGVELQWKKKKKGARKGRMVGGLSASRAAERENQLPPPLPVRCWGRGRVRVYVMCESWTPKWTGLQDACLQ